MSFDVFFIARRKGEETGFSLLEVLNAFEKHCELKRAIRQTHDETYICWDNHFEADRQWGNVTIHVLNEDEYLCSGISINRPSGDPVFWQTMFELMHEFPLGMVFPTSNLRWILANESFREDFPDLPIEIVSTSEALLETITND